MELGLGGKLNLKPLGNAFKAISQHSLGTALKATRQHFSERLPQVVRNLCGTSCRSHFPAVPREHLPAAAFPIVAQPGLELGLGLALELGLRPGLALELGRRLGWGLGQDWGWVSGWS